MTPDLHRVHHSSWRSETDSNYGAVFPIWDMILGTYVAQPRDSHETMQLGLEQPRGADAHRIRALLLSPLRAELGPAVAPRVDEAPNQAGA